MKFLVDNQLPPALARFLADRSEGGVHVRDLGLGESSDTEVWNYASRHGYVLVSKDEDFLHHAIRSAGGELLWVRIGNCRRDDLLQAFEEAWQALAERLSEGDRILELR